MYGGHDKSRPVSQIFFHFMIIYAIMYVSFLVIDPLPIFFFLIARQIILFPRLGGFQLDGELVYSCYYIFGELRG